MITIVSGLPRCGTSLMMRMLEMGGIPALVDGIREADEDNPKGYYELEAVKEIKQDASFLDAADGKVFKMVSQLLYDLPEGRGPYKVVFMLRSLTEMMASQNTMLKRLGKPLSEDDAKMTELLEKHLVQIKGWLESRDDIDVHYADYNELMSDPTPHIPQINAFLGCTLDESAMLQSIDKKLYRQRRTVTA